VSSTQDRYPEFMADQREFFDRLVTEDWSTYESAEWNDTRRREVAAVLSRASAKRVLDVGCGCGFHDVEIAECPGVDEVVGIDYSPRSIETAEREFPNPRVHRFVADIFEFEQEPFDLVLSFQVIEHLTSPLEFLEACLRNVRPGGVVAVVTPNGDRLDNRLRRLLGKPSELLDPQHYREYSPRELRDVAATLAMQPLATVGLSARLTLPRVNRQVLPAPTGRLLARTLPTVSSSFAQLWRRRA
jgi:2-polyprenyl-3-methyl-5-hydroxy-6-metoxy-1,4-benzoquinol methylase